MALCQKNAKVDGSYLVKLTLSNEFGSFQQQLRIERKFMNHLYNLTTSLFFSLTLLVPAQSCGSSNQTTKTDSKGSWILPVAGLLTASYIIGQTIYTKIGPKYGGRVRNPEDINYLQQQAANKVRAQAQKDLAKRLLQDHRIQPDATELFQYNRTSDNQAFFELCPAKDVFCRFIEPAAKGTLNNAATSGFAPQIIDITNDVNNLPAAYAKTKKKIEHKTNPARARFVTEATFPWSQYPWMRLKAWASWI